MTKGRLNIGIEYKTKWPKFNNFFHLLLEVADSIFIFSLDKGVLFGVISIFKLCFSNSTSIINVSPSTEKLIFPFPISKEIVLKMVFILPIKSKFIPPLLIIIFGSNSLNFPFITSISFSSLNIEDLKDLEIE